MVKAIRFVFQGIGVSIRDLFFPPQCLHCKRILQIDPLNFLCNYCSLNIHPFPKDIVQTQILKRINPAYLDNIFIAFQFNDVVQTVIHNIKYNKMPDLGTKIGEMAATQLQKHFDITEEKGFLPVPLHVTRQKERDYNQSTFIGNGLVKLIGGKLYEDILFRRKYTISQTTLNREDRISNVRDAFSMGFTSIKLPNSIYLVDDLITTGATMNECARVLKNNGVTSVMGIAVASPL